MSGATTGSITAIILGAQRYGSLAQLAANKSEVMTGVASAMQWAYGDFGLISDGRDGRHTGRLLRWLSSTSDDEFHEARRLGEEAFASDNAEVDSLLSILVMFGLVLVSIMMLQSCVHCLWRTRVNRRYYAVKRNLTLSIQYDTLAFIPLPSVFVTPGALCTTCTHQGLCHAGPRPMSLPSNQASFGPPGGRQLQI